MPNSITPKLKEFASRLLALEAASAKAAHIQDSPAFRVCEKLRYPLCKLAGTQGFRSLLTRANALAGAEVPWLRGLQIKPDGSFAGFETLQPKPDRKALDLGETVLIAHVLGLLVTFIGRALTLLLLRDIWPETDDLNL
jgi:hypothetical protein